MKNLQTIKSILNCTLNVEHAREEDSVFIEVSESEFGVTVLNEIAQAQN
ncbi:hypothetical protein ABIA69_004778 [Lysinibacillus parviboronicapiens]|uniref:Uncharacterized protein n=1 Tax=Lysinibacillus parviboronicapiens TaxID=436516 RepID=A0ABV2PRG9_9BACI